MFPVVAKIKAIEHPTNENMVHLKMERWEFLPLVAPAAPK